MEAWITGFIFYFINDVIKSDKKKISLSRITNNNIVRLSSKTKDLVKEICSCTRTQDDTVISREIFSQKCEMINIYNTLFNSWYFGNITCRDFILKYCNESRKSVYDILIFQQLLEEVWLKPLTSILDNINNIEILLEVNKTSSKLDLVSYHLWNCYIQTNYLEKLNSDFWLAYNKQERELRKPKINEESSTIFIFNKKVHVEQTK